jgi:hypothetical protein
MNFPNGIQVPVEGFTPPQIITGCQAILHLYYKLSFNPLLHDSGDDNLRSPFLESRIFADKLWCIVDWMSPESEANTVWSQLSNPKKKALTKHLLLHILRLFEIFTNWARWHTQQIAKIYQVKLLDTQTGLIIPM